MFLPLLSADQREAYAKLSDVDFSVGRTGVGRFRINMHRQRGSSCVAVRFVPNDVPTFSQLRLRSGSWLRQRHARAGAGDRRAGMGRARRSRR